MLILFDLIMVCLAAFLARFVDPALARTVVYWWFAISLFMANRGNEYSAARPILVRARVVLFIAGIMQLLPFGWISIAGFALLLVVGEVMTYHFYNKRDEKPEFVEFVWVQPSIFMPTDWICVRTKDGKIVGRIKGFYRRWLVQIQTPLNYGAEMTLEEDFEKLSQAKAWGLGILLGEIETDEDTEKIRQAH